MRIKKNLTVEQVSRLLPILVNLANYSMHDIRSFNKLTSLEKLAFNNDKNAFDEFFTKNEK